MTISAGSRLGPYEVIGPLGAGGMGEVWKARDTRLDRNVAIKVLPAELAQNAQLRLRFEREARTISQLNHPHICTLFDVGDGYLVMELLEGESLADRILRGPMPLDEVLRYGVEIGEALDKAHRAGVIHRDLKPGNVMITKSGAKLLDFGLAKSSVIEISADGATQQKALTQEGTILGTFQYMAPEQLEGMEADARTDIFAFGALLYEMATGRRAFEGKTKTSLIAAIVKEQPRPIADLRPLTPPALQHVVDKCLAKDADDRWQSAHDVAAELEWISQAGSQAGVAAPIISARSRRRRLLTVAAIAGWALAFGALALALTTASRLRAVNQVTQTEISASVASVFDEPLGVSPDGRRLAIEVAEGTMTRLSIRELATGEVKLLAGTEGASFPFWAPDGHAVGFFAGGKLKTVAIDSGAIQTICNAPYGRGGAWSPAGLILFAPNISTPIMKVAESGGIPAPVTRFQPGASQWTHRNPMFLPDGKHFLYRSASEGGLNATTRVGSVDGGFEAKVLDYASSMVLVNGWLLTLRDRNLIAQQFDADSMAVKGKPVAIAQTIDWYPPRFAGMFAAGANTLIYQHASQPKRQLLRLDPSDLRPMAVGDLLYLSSLAPSPDGSRVIVDRFDPITNTADFWMVSLGGVAPPARLTFDGHGTMDGSSVFSPDGQRLALTSPDHAGGSNYWIQPPGGGTRTSLGPALSGFGILTDWSRDGTTVLFSPQLPKTGQDVQVIHLDGDHKIVPLLHGDADELGARFSPDGKWVAYQSNETGRFEIYVTNYPGATAKWQVSTGGGQAPYWSADGSLLYYLAGDRVVAAAVHPGDSFSADAAQPVEALGDHIVDFAVAHNGRIVALREVDPGKPPLTVVINWEELLKQH